MKLLPNPLSPLGAPSFGMWSSDLLWRYPAAPPSPLAELKTQLPSQLSSSDPRIWGREEVQTFLRWTEREFDLPKLELDLFQMNGKALCLLTKTDLAERCPGAGDIIHNVLQLLIRDSQMLHRHMPSSPVTPTSRYPLSPLSHPPTPNWTSLAPPDNAFYASHLQHFMAQNSVTLSPAPSIESQNGSPSQNAQEATANLFGSSSQIHARSSSVENTDMEARSSSASGSDSARNSSTQPGTSSGSSHHSDSDEDHGPKKFESKTFKLLPPPMSHHSSALHHQSPPLTPKEVPSAILQQHNKLKMEYQHNLFFNNNNNNNINNSTNNDSLSNGSGSSSSPSTPTTPGYMVKREFFPDTPTEPNTSMFKFAKKSHFLCETET
jgi:ETS translocation variant 6/7